MFRDGGEGRVCFTRDVTTIWWLLINFWDIKLEEVQDKKEVKEDEIIVEEDECLIINIFELLHNTTFVEADDDDDA